MTPKNGVPDQALPELKLTRVQRSSLVIIARARREEPGDEAIIYHGRSRKYYCSVWLKKIDVETFRN